MADTVQVKGVGDADDGSGVDLADLWGELSARYDGDGKADNAAMVRARLSADGGLMQRILASEGYYDAVVDTRIDRGPREEGQERRRRSRSEEHTSELQSLMRISYAVFCLKKKKKQTKPSTSTK